ncbi:retrovirus-related pol polyprotein from transposon TNT 1-94 [Tanacetum coccineum]
MSHEIRSPLSGGCHAEILSTTKLDKDQKKLLSVILSSGDLAFRLINDILDISKVDSDVIKLEATKFRPRENSKQGLFGYPDAGYLSDPHKARSQTGYVFLNGGTTISWRSQKQTLVATSSNHAKFIVLHEASRECVMTQLIVTSCGLNKEKNPTIIHEDNAACGRTNERRLYQKRQDEHIPPRYFAYTQDLIKDNQIEIKKHVHAIGMRHVQKT